MANAGLRTTMMVVHTASAVKNGHGKMIRHFMSKLARNKRNIAFLAGGMIAAAATGGPDFGDILEKLDLWAE